MKITRFELEVMHELSKGLCNKDVATRLGLSYKTVKHHITMLNHKLGTKTRIQIVLWYLAEIGRLIPLDMDDNNLPISNLITQELL